ncbi:MAG: septum formation initiator family protein [Eubacteriales bacterium]|nr:septum formation initiator family protein [Eubacteriales bacterium]
MANRRYSEGYRSYDRKYAATERHTYVDGNTVRRLDTLPRRREQEERWEEERRQRRIRRRIQRQPVHMPGIDRASLAFLVVALAVTLYICFSYIQTQNKVYEQKNQVVQMESSVASQKENNDIAYQEILDSVDLSEVYEKATKELGMVQAQEKQIYTYKSKKSDTVKQYGEIPDAD